MKTLTIEFQYGTPQKFKENIVWNWQLWGTPQIERERIVFTNELGWKAVLLPQYEEKCTSGGCEKICNNYVVHFLPPNGMRCDEKDIEDAIENFIMNVLQEYKKDNYKDFVWMVEERKDNKKDFFLTK